ncbi:MAG: S26 family signal peptidase [Candidatus Phytoplasma pyri]
MIKIKFKNIIFFIKKIIITFFSLILIYSAIITIHDFIDPKTTVKHLFFNYKYIVSSGSMEPTIKEGDGVFVFKINDCRDLKPSLKPHILEGEFDKNNDNGDIIVFQNKYNPEEIIIHRVVKNDKKKK